MKTCLLCEGVSDTDQPHCSACGLHLVSIDEVHSPTRRGEVESGHAMLGATVGGKYRITGVLGRGGMGTVFAAVHEGSLAQVALKILHPRHAGRPDLRRFFADEARKAGLVNHEHCARVLDVGETDDGSIYLAMELVEGVSLDECIHSRERLSPADIVDILSQICQALTAAHAAGLVHRDLSARNVAVIVRDGRPWVKVLDFGIAKSGPRELGGPAGFASPPYAAPEHLAAGEVDARADLYSVGVLAYEALTCTLPVAGQTPTELAEATMAGRLRPLKAPKGTPRRLIRLVLQLLSRDPADRPPSAAAVLRELERIRQPRDRPFRVAAVVGLLLSLPAFVFAHADVAPRYLDLAPGERLVLDERRPEANARAQELRSDDLAQLRFVFGGFSGPRLRLDAYSLDESLADAPLAPELSVDGRELVFAASRSPAYARLVSRLAELAAPVTLVFEIPGLPRLGYARVLVDDQAPELLLRLQTADSDVVGGERRIEYRATDAGTLEHVGLTAEWDDGGSARIVPLPCLTEPTLHAVRAVELLGAAIPGVAARNDVTVRYSAVDRAGNAAESRVLRLRRVDLRAPAIAAVEGLRRSSIITYDSQGAHLVVRPDQVEGGLRVLATAPGETLAREVALDRNRIVLPPSRPDGEVPFPDGQWQFGLRDDAGNQSAPMLVELRFRSEEPEASFAVVAGVAHARLVRTTEGSEFRLVTDGTSCVLQLSCNPVYGARRAVLRPQPPQSKAGVPRELEVAATQAGSAMLTLPPDLPDGEARLQIELEDAVGAVREVELPVLVMAAPMQLRVPDPGRCRFVQELVQLDFLTVDHAAVGPGRAWSLSPADVRLLHGRVWFGRSGAATPRPLGPRPQRDSPLFVDLPLLHGDCVLALELYDPLDRPVAVTRGAAAAPAAEGNPGAEVARFVHHPGGVELASSRVEVEFGQPARVRLRSPLPFRADDRVRLRVGSVDLPVAVEPVEDGVVLQADLPYELVAGALGWLGRSAGDVVEGQEGRLPAVLHTPAELFALDLPLRTIRSTLRPVTWAELARGVSLPVPLSTIVMVPTLAPRDGFWAESVPEDAPRRAEFRCAPAQSVRNVHDVFLQSAEMTRAEYAALTRAFRELPVERRQPKSLVHAWDPDGQARLEQLRPLAWSAEQWAHAVAVDGNRPVTGVSFFQAYTIARIAGLLLADDPELLRLPMGVELEVAALSGVDPRPWNGASRAHGTAALLLALAQWPQEPSRWPPTASEARSAGDAVASLQGHAISGLDFGVREWVMDLPLPASEGREFVDLFVADLDQHVTRALGFATGTPAPARVEPEIALYGVVRGVAAGESGGLVDVRTGLPPMPDQPLSASVPGVVRSLVLPRCGLTFDVLDPRLRLVGFRLAGDRRFVREARR